MNYTGIMDRLLKAEVDEGRVKGNSALVLKDGKAVFDFPPRPISPSNLPQEPPIGAGGETPPPLEPPDVDES